MNRGLYNRLAKLEAARRVEPLILHFEDGNKTPMTIAGTAKNFFRLVSAMEEYGRPGTVLRGALFELDLVRRAVRIEGQSAQLFLLAQALIKGPRGDTQYVSPDWPSAEAFAKRRIEITAPER